MSAMDGRRPLKVGISGSYGGFNLGDEAILQVIVAQLRRALPVEVTVFTRDAEDTKRRHQVERTVLSRELSRRETQELIAGMDLFILGGGGILYDADADMYLREVLLSHEVKTPVMIYAISSGPLVDLPLRSRVRDELNRATVVTARDRHTRQILEELGVERDIVLTADPAMLLEPEPLTLDKIFRAEAIDTDSRLVGFSVREPGPAVPQLNVEHYHRLLANAGDFIIDRRAGRRGRGVGGAPLGQEGHPHGPSELLARPPARLGVHRSRHARGSKTG